MQRVLHRRLCRFGYRLLLFLPLLLLLRLPRSSHRTRLQELQLLLFSWPWHVLVTSRGLVSSIFETPFQYTVLLGCRRIRSRGDGCSFSEEARLSTRGGWSGTGECRVSRGSRVRVEIGGGRCFRRKAQGLCSFLGG